MQRFLVLIAAGLLSGPAVADEPDWSRAPQYEVALSSFAFAPASLRLGAGRPVILHLVNTGRGSHNFSAPEFFAAATIRGADRGVLDKGAVEVRGRSAKDIALVPRAGHYKLRCTHTFHSAFGMTGKIAVE